MAAQPYSTNWKVQQKIRQVFNENRELIWLEIKVQKPPFVQAYTATAAALLDRQVHPPTTCAN
jgi:uncharacterized membrane protein YfbV (UPF0208 family)